MQAVRVVAATCRRLTPEGIVRVESAPPRIAIIVGDKRGGRSMASTAARSKHVDNADVETLLPRTSHASHEIELSEVIHGQHEIEEVVEAQPVLVASRTPPRDPKNLLQSSSVTAFGFSGSYCRSSLFIRHLDVQAQLRRIFT